MKKKEKLYYDSRANPRKGEKNSTLPLCNLVNTFKVFTRSNQISIPR